MREAAVARLESLREEFGTCAARVRALEQELSAVHERMVGIAGAAEVLEELLAADASVTTRVAAGNG